jgi:TolA-binding protein
MRLAFASCLFVCLALICAGGGSRAATVSEEVARLRTEANDLDAAVALAQEYLQNNPTLTLEHQSVQFELGRTYYAAKQYGAALAALRGLVADYSMTTLDTTNEAFVVDDAQFYVGVVEHYFGDRAKGIEGYTKAIDDFPKSNRRSQALMLLAGVHEQDGEKAKALERFRQLVAEHPQSEQAPEAQLHVGHLLRADRKLDDAIAAFQRIPKDWPESKHAPMALLDANRVLMEQELSSAEHAQSEEQILKNEEAIQANVKLLLEKYGDSEQTAQIMQDLINYYRNPHHVRRDAEAAVKTTETVTWLLENRPSTRQGLRAICEYAVMLGSEHSEEALAHLDWVIEIARTADDTSLLFDARFAKAQVLRRAGEKEQAREIWTELLELASDEHLADEIGIMIILTKPVEEGVAAFEQIAEDESRHSDIRSTAMLFLASYHKSEGRFEEALELAETVIAEFPETLNAGTAEKLRGQLRDLVRVPVKNRGNYRPR